MMDVQQALRFQWSPSVLVGGGLVLIGIAVLSIWTWRRTGFSKGVAVVELLRIAIALLIVVLLAQPEWIEVTPPPEHPEVVVLSDVSNSMDTEDVHVSDGQPPISRRAWVERVTGDQAFWSKLEQRYRVVFEPFAASAGENRRDGSDYAAALARVLEREQTVRGVVVLGDGDWNEGSPPLETAARLAMRRIPIFAVPTGQETPLPDLALRNVNVPAVTVEERTLRIPFSIESTIGRDIQTIARLRVTDGESAAMAVRVPAMGRFQGAFTWTPSMPGEFKIRLTVPVARGETSSENNEVIVPVRVQKEAIQVLLIEGTARWEYRYLRNAFERDPGVDVHALLFHPGLGRTGGGRGYLKSFPQTREELAKYDVVFVGDVGVDQLSPEACRRLKGLVEQQASGLVLMPGLAGRLRSLQQTELAELFPVELDPQLPRGEGSAQLQPYALTDFGRKSLLTKLTDDEVENLELWERLPGFSWHAGVLRALPGSETLVVHGAASNAYGRIPLIVTRPFGHGKVLFMATDGAWRWRRGVEDRYHYRFWSQVARWMAYQRNMARGEGMRLFYTPDHPRQGTTVLFHANVMDSTGEPLESGEVVLQVVDPSGKTETVRMTPERGNWGLFSGSYEARAAGEHRLKLTCKENGGTIETTLFVQSVDRERPGRPARPDVLEELAAATGGRLLATTDIERVRDLLARLPRLEPMIRRLRLWSHPMTLALVVALMGAFWVGRKIVGQI